MPRVGESSDVAPALKAAVPETGDWNTSHVRISLVNCLIYGPPLTVFVWMHFCLSDGYDFVIIIPFYLRLTHDFRNSSRVTKCDPSFCNRDCHEFANRQLSRFMNYSAINTRWNDDVLDFLLLFLVVRKCAYNVYTQCVYALQTIYVDVLISMKISAYYSTD